MVNFVIMKKLYIQPIVAELQLKAENLMGTELGSGPATPGVVDAPIRRGNPVAVMYI